LTDWACAAIAPADTTATTATDMINDFIQELLSTPAAAT
jgi:hypothetical protein